MAKISVFDQDFDDALSNRTDPIVYLPKVAAPFTTVVKRALMTDLANDLLPRFGVERVMTQAIQEVQGENGPTNQRVFKPINDQHDAVRFVGSINQNNNADGQHLVILSTSYLEVTFYGTGLNLLTIIDGSARSVSVSVDGGSASTVTNTGSGVLVGRNYSANIVLNVVSGLTLGIHTVKLSHVTAAILMTGYEVLNTNSTLQLLPGRSYLGGKRLYKAAASTDAYNSNFESGTLGTKGGHVVVYQKSDGTVAKALQPTNASQANLTSADHTNEEVIRTYNWREFGAGRTDDFSSLTETAASDRAFTLDDGTTTLVGFQIIAAVSQTFLQLNSASSTLTFTFIGTGLDVGGAGGGGSTVGSVLVDGISIGNLVLPATAGPSIKIVSGLPYGTHTVKFTGTANFFLFTTMIVYGPSKPALPSGAIELGDYYLMADFVATTFGVDVVPSGVLRKFTIREWVYVGTGFTITTLQPISNPGGFAVRSSTIGETYSYTFFGTGFDLTGHGSIGTASGTISIDGSLYTGAASVTNTATWTPGTSTFTLSSAACAGRVRVTGLTLGLHKVTLTVATAESLNIPNIDIITPVHSPKINQPGDLQNTLPIGSCAIGDSRKFSSTSVKTLANWAQAVGVVNSPSTTSTSFVPCPDLSVTIKTNGNPINISYYMSSLWAPIGSAPPTGETTIYVDGIQVSKGCLTSNTATLIYENLSENIIVAVSAGTHKVDVYWKTQNAANTLYCQNYYRCLTVSEK